MKLNLKLTLLAFLSVYLIHAQDPFFRQANSSSNFLNPALTGTRQGWLANFNHRNQWADIQGTYVTTFTGIQKQLTLAKMGLGLNVVHDEAGGGTLTQTHINIPVSKYLELGKNQLSFGIQGSIVRKVLDFGLLTFGDQIDQQLGFVSSGPTRNVVMSVRTFFNLAAGAVFQGKWGNIGIAAHNITQPNESFGSGTSRLPLRLTAHGTYQLQIKQFGIAATAVYQKQQDFNQVYSFLTAKYKVFKIMGGYAFNDAILMGAGLQFKQIGVNYQYELTSSKLTSSTGGSHEISLNWRFGAKNNYEDKLSIAF